MSRFIRWKGFIPFFVVIAAVCAFNMLFLDSILKNAARSAVEDLNGAEVEIDDFDFQLLDAALVSEGIRVANKNNPAKNLFEIERIELDFDANLLSRKKIVADKIIIKGLRPETDRPGADGVKGTTPEATPAKDKDKGEDTKEEPFDFSAFSDKLDVQKLADELNIPIINEAKALDELIRKKKKYWEKNIARISDTRELKRLLARVRKIDTKSYKSLKDLPRLQEDIKAVQKASKKLNERIKEIKKLRKAFKKDRRILEAKIRRLRKMSSKGISAMLLPDGSRKDLAKKLLNAVFDDSLVARGFYFLELYEKYKGFIPKKKKLDKPATGPGVAVDFIKAGDAPMFYAKNIAFSGERNDAALSGNIRGLSSDLSWRPVDFDLKYTEKQTPFQIKGRLEMRDQKVAGEVRAIARKFSFEHLDVSGSNILNGVKGKGNIVLNFRDTGEKLIMNMSVAAIGKASFLLKTDKMGAETKDTLNKLFTDLKNLSLRVNFEKSGDETRYSVKSSIYKVIGGRLNKMLTKRLDKAKKDVERLAKRKAEETLAPLKSQLAGLSGKGLNKTLSTLNPAQRKLKAKQKKLDKTLKKAGEEKVKNLLKLFK